jgi:hypothetical protein
LHERKIRRFISLCFIGVSPLSLEANYFRTSKDLQQLMPLNQSYVKRRGKREEKVVFDNDNGSQVVQQCKMSLLKYRGVE